jgi:hypothetical protein
METDYNCTKGEIEEWAYGKSGDSPSISSRSDQGSRMSFTVDGNQDFAVHRYTVAPKIGDELSANRKLSGIHGGISPEK